MGAGPPRIPDGLKTFLDTHDWVSVKAQIDALPNIGPPDDTNAPGFDVRARIAPFVRADTLGPAGEATVLFILDRHANPPKLTIQIEVEGT